MSPILLALLAAFTFAFGNILQKLGMLKNDSQFNLKLVLKYQWLLGMAFSGVGISLVYYVTAKSDLTLIQPILSLNPLISVLLGAVFLKEHLAAIHYKAIAIGFVGVIVLSLDGKSSGSEVFDNKFWFLIPCILLMLHWWLVSKKAAAYRFALLGGMGFGAATVIYKILALRFLVEGKINWENINPLIFSIETPLYLFTYVGGTLWAQLALVRGQASFVIPIIATVGTLVPIIGGIVVFGEEMTLFRLLGLGFVLLSLFMFGKPPSKSQEVQ